MIRLGMIDAPPKEDDDDNFSEENVEVMEDGEVNIPKLKKVVAPKKVKVPEVNEYGAYLWEAQQAEVSSALQMWYDLLELREGRYRLKPLRILRIAAIQNNISMLLVEYYIHYRKSEASQRRMSEANSLMTFMVDTVR